MTVRIPITKYGEVVGYALADDRDSDLLNALKWSLNGSGRPYAFVPKVGPTAMHRLICGLFAGDKRVVHHRNGDPLDNRRKNLEVLSSCAEHARRHAPLVPYRRLARAVAVIARREIVKATHNRTLYNAGCRCDECTAAVREYMRTLRGRTPPRHGNSGYTNYGCRCVVCKSANSEYQRTRRAA